MAKIYKLTNQFKNYDWGSAGIIPDFLNFKNDDNSPYAEMWMGTHSGAPSKAALQKDLPGDAGESLVSLSELTGELPFLFKILAVDKPLSIQVHPDKEQAVNGFEAEEKTAVPLQDPSRNYKDPNPKHEMICALSEFKLMAGFRKTEEILNSFKTLVFASGDLSCLLAPMIAALEQNSLGGFLKEHFNFSAPQKEKISSEIIKIDPAALMERNSSASKPSGCAAGCGTERDITLEQWDLMKKFACLYKKDPAVLSPLYLNILTLRPAQAVYLPAKSLHAYLSGFGLELMNSSDNVLRGGLTPKNVDTKELLKIVNLNPFLPDVITDPLDGSFFRYPVPVKDFSLTVIRGNGNEISYNADSHVIGIVSEGELIAEERTFKKGESFFLPKSEDRLTFKGGFTLYAASAGNALTP